MCPPWTSCTSPWTWRRRPRGGRSPCSPSAACARRKQRSGRAPSSTLHRRPGQSQMLQMSPKTNKKVCICPRIWPGYVCVIKFYVSILIFTLTSSFWMPTKITSAGMQWAINSYSLVLTWASLVIIFFKWGLNWFWSKPLGDKICSDFSFSPPPAVLDSALSQFDWRSPSDIPKQETSTRPFLNENSK